MGRPATEVFQSSINGYRTQRRKHLKLYPTVAETLLKIRGQGTMIIAYTESMEFYSTYRIRRLGLDGVLDYVFCPGNHSFPQTLSAEDHQYYNEDKYSLDSSKLKNTPTGSSKPDVDVLKAIIDEFNIKKEHCVFVGDSLMKDIMMARDFGIDDVWAKYGEGHTRPEYSLLQDVTHWTREDVEREQKIKERQNVDPTHTLDKAFSEILNHFEFGEFR